MTTVELVSKLRPPFWSRILPAKPTEPANPSFFIMFNGITCELSQLCPPWPVRPPNQTLVSQILAGRAQILQNGGLCLLWPKRKVGWFCWVLGYVHTCTLYTINHKTKHFSGPVTCSTDPDLRIRSIELQHWNWILQDVKEMCFISLV